MLHSHSAFLWLGIRPFIPMSYRVTSLAMAAITPTIAPNSQGSFVYATSQWETTLQCNVVFHWLGAFRKWSKEEPWRIDVNASRLRIHKKYSHYDVSKWKHSPHYWPFVRGIHRSPGDTLTKASDAQLWCFLWCAPEQMIQQTLETPVIWGVMELIVTSLLWQNWVRISMTHCKLRWYTYQISTLYQIGHTCFHNSEKQEK